MARFISQNDPMRIELTHIAIHELVDGFTDDDEGGVTGFGGRLDIRPPYQREFVYGRAKMHAVIHSLRRNLPLSTMYWAKLRDGRFEVLDGQQRTISICRFVNGGTKQFSVKVPGDDATRSVRQYFHSLEPGDRERFLQIKLPIYICDYDEDDDVRLAWFETINIVGEKLTNQELRNAIYHGPWLSDAKRYFSRTQGPAYVAATSPCGEGQYLKGIPIRQEYLETAIKWASGAKNDDEIREYMAKRRQLNTASELRKHFDSVIEWIKFTFIVYRKEMADVDWGNLYRKYGKDEINSNNMEIRVRELMEDEDIDSGSGIYDFVFDDDARHLHFRAFGPRVRRIVYERQGRKCKMCGKTFKLNEMHGDHKKPFSRKGGTRIGNLQMLCEQCNLEKGAN